MRKKLTIAASAMALGAAALLTPAGRRFAKIMSATEQLPANPVAASRRFARVDNIEMSWRESGEGPVVIAVHGIPTSPELWRDVLPRLSGVRALAWELVGYGLSIEEGCRDISVSAQADYLAAWMKHLGIENAILVGHDIGGGVVQQLAVRYPKVCCGLFLTNAVGYDSWPIPSVKLLQKTAPVAKHMPDAMFKGLIGSLLARGHDDADAAAAAYRIHGARYLERDGAAALIRQAVSLDVEDTLSISGRLSALGVPARLVWGEADEFQKVEYGRKFARDLDAPLHLIPGGKHFTPEDHPDIIAEEIMKLVETVHGLNADIQ